MRLKRPHRLKGPRRRIPRQELQRLDVRRVRFLNADPHRVDRGRPVPLEPEHGLVALIGPQFHTTGQDPFPLPRRRHDQLRILRCQNVHSLHFGLGGLWRGRRRCRRLRHGLRRGFRFLQQRRLVFLGTPRIAIPQLDPVLRPVSGKVRRVEDVVLTGQLLPDPGVELLELARLRGDERGSPCFKGDPAEHRLVDFRPDPDGVNGHVDLTGQRQDFLHGMFAQGSSLAVIVRPVAQEGDHLPARHPPQQLDGLVEGIVKGGIAPSHRGIDGCLGGRAVSSTAQDFHLTGKAHHLNSVFGTEQVDETLGGRLGVLHPLPHGATGVQGDDGIERRELRNHRQGLLVDLIFPHAKIPRAEPLERHPVLGDQGKDRDLGKRGGFDLIDDDLRSGCLLPPLDPAGSRLVLGEDCGTEKDQEHRETCCHESNFSPRHGTLLSSSGYPKDSASIIAFPTRQEVLGLSMQPLVPVSALTLHGRFSHRLALQRELYDTRNQIESSDGEKLLQ